MKFSGSIVKENVFAMAAIRVKRPADPHEANARVECSRCGGFLVVACSKADLETMTAKLLELTSMREGVCGECREGNHKPSALAPKQSPISEK